MSLTALARRRSDSMYAVCENFLDLDSTRIQMDAWGYTSKPFWSVLSCHLYFLPGDFHP